MVMTSLTTIYWIDREQNASEYPKIVSDTLWWIVVAAYTVRSDPNLLMITSIYHAQFDIYIYIYIYLVGDRHLGLNIAIIVT